MQFSLIRHCHYCYMTKPGTHVHPLLIMIHGIRNCIFDIVLTCNALVDDVWLGLLILENIGWVPVVILA